jgi:hypothetical protein
MIYVACSDLCDVWVYQFVTFNNEASLKFVCVGG